MSSNAISAFGTLIQRGNGAGPEVFTTIAEIESIAFNIKVGSVDISNMSSPNGWKEFLPTMKEGGSFTLNIAYIPGDGTQNVATGLLGDLKNRVKRNFKLQFPDAGPTVWPFTAYVTDFNFTGKHDDALRATVTLMVTGEPGIA